jgi:hypothetical protein
LDACAGAGIGAGDGECFANRFHWHVILTELFSAFDRISWVSTDTHQLVKMILLTRVDGAILTVLEH